MDSHAMSKGFLLAAGICLMFWATPGMLKKSDYFLLGKSENAGINSGQFFFYA